MIAMTTSSSTSVNAVLFAGRASWLCDETHGLPVTTAVPDERGAHKPLTTSMPCDRLGHDLYQFRRDAQAVYRCRDRVRRSILVKHEIVRIGRSQAALRAGDLQFKQIHSVRSWC